MRSFTEAGGPDDLPDERVNGDPDSTVGEDDVDPSFEAEDEEEVVEARPHIASPDCWCQPRVLENYRESK